MRRSGKGSGGGQGMNRNTSPAYKQGQSRKGINTRAVSQIGNNLGNHVTDRRQVIDPRERLHEAPGPISVELGNKNSERLSGANAGCGKGRTVMPSGGQGCH